MQTEAKYKYIIQKLFLLLYYLLIACSGDWWERNFCSNFTTIINQVHSLLMYRQKHILIVPTCMYTACQYIMCHVILPCWKRDKRRKNKNIHTIKYQDITKLPRMLPSCAIWLNFNINNNMHAANLYIHCSLFVFYSTLLTWAKQ